MRRGSTSPSTRLVRERAGGRHARLSTRSDILRQQGVVVRERGQDECSKYYSYIDGVGRAQPDADAPRSYANQQQIRDSDEERVVAGIVQPIPEVQAPCVV